MQHFMCCALALPPRIEDGTCIGFVAKSGSRVIAGADAVLLDWGPTRGDSSGMRARIVNVFTDPTSHRQGLAVALVQQVMDACRSRGISAFSFAASPEGQPCTGHSRFQPYEQEMVLR